MKRSRDVAIVVLAHNEEAFIAACLRSLPPDLPVHVVVNGSRDGTAARARAFAGAIVHDYAEGGKARSWNRFVLDELDDIPDVLVFVDGDAIVAPGSIDALHDALASDDGANAAAALPLNGRRAAQYRAETLRDHGLFGDLYALRGDFVRRMRAAGVRLPDDLVGDDGLIGSLARCDLKRDADARSGRLIPVADAGFFMARPARLGDPPTWPTQYRRMINYSVRHFQNRIVRAIMQDDGAAALPRELAALYPQWLPRFRPRRSPAWWWFDRRALARMRAAAARYR